MALHAQINNRYLDQEVEDSFPRQREILVTITTGKMNGQNLKAFKHFVGQMIDQCAAEVREPRKRK